MPLVSLSAITPRRSRFATLLISTILCSGAAVPAFAQTGQLQPVHRNIDANGIDLTNGGFFIDFKEGSIGSGDTELPLMRRNQGGSQWDNIFLQRSMNGQAATIWVTIGRESEKFVGTIDTLTSTRANGSRLDVSNGGYVYTARDGTSITFTDTTYHANGGDETGLDTFCYPDAAQSLCRLLPERIESPDGRSSAIDWELAPRCQNEFEPDMTLDCRYYWRLQRVSNGFGYSIAFHYQSDDGAGLYDSPPPPAIWFRRTSASFHNATAGAAPLATIGYAYPAADITDVTDMGGAVWRFTSTAYGDIVGIRRPGATSDTTAVSGSSGMRTVTRDGVPTTYAMSVSGNMATTTVTNALGNATVYVSDLASGRITSVTNALNQTSTFQYDGYGRLTRATQPEGDYVQLTLDDRGNARQIDRVAKPGSGLATITTSASFEQSCASIHCNSPQAMTDALGRVTDYEYDAVTGQPLSVKAPAPVAGATRPETRYTYAPDVTTRLIGISRCVTGSAPACIGTPNEVRETIGYDDNGNVVARTTADGSNTLSATTTYSYTPLGDLASVDGPLPGPSDTTSFRYDAARRRVGAVAPDPDGAGPLKRRAVRIVYDVAGRVTQEQSGVVADASDAGWSAFAAAAGRSSAYDAQGRIVRQTLTSPAGDQGVSDYRYDALGQRTCTIVRMDPGGWGTPPTSCAPPQTGGAQGPDRVSRTGYDALGRVTVQTSAVGTTAESDDVAASYTANGRLASLIDAQANRTTYTYDGFDRLSRTYYPPAAAGANASSTSDYEQLGYDANGNVTSRRLRDGQTLYYGYDALNRRTYDDNPNTNVAEVDVSYSYDNLGAMLRAQDQNGWYAAYEYDALGRATRQYSNVYGNRFQYDAAGRRTRQTWDDGFFVTTDYLVTGETSAIREQGGLALAAFDYDDLGRRMKLTRANGAITSYSYDPVSRLNGLTHDVAGTSADLTLAFGYNAAGQITTRTSSNDAYRWNGAVNIDRAYAVNGLNQYTQSGGVTPTYDARGNLTQGGGQSYVYNTRNQLFNTGTAGQLFYRNPTGVLSQILSGGGGVKLDYVGPYLTTEVGLSGQLNRRYVYGPGEDEPLVQYEGAGTTDRRYLHADERGSVIAVSDNGGTVTAINTYDEYGIPGAGNTGWFQYTGQKWISELGMYDYKARMYSPTLGRFLQTDPIGYADGMNRYGYVGSDPVNRTDPSGMMQEVCKVSYGSATVENGESAPSMIPIKTCTWQITSFDWYVWGLDGQNSRYDGAMGGWMTSSGPKDGGPQNMQPVVCPIAYTPQGDTKGENPRPASGRYNTDLPGGFQDAWKVFSGLSRLAGEPGYTIVPNPSFDNATTLAVSQPGGSVRLRVGVDYSGGARVGLSPRIDIKAGTFDLKVAETIHFTGGKGNMCPTR